MGTQLEPEILTSFLQELIKQEDSMCQDSRNLKDTTGQFDLIHVYRAFYETMSELILLSLQGKFKMAECTWAIEQVPVNAKGSDSHEGCSLSKVGLCA